MIFDNWLDINSQDIHDINGVSDFVTSCSTFGNKFYTCMDVFCCSLFQNICAKTNCQTAALQAMSTRVEERYVSFDEKNRRYANSLIHG